MSKELITDYSNIFFDYAYLRKPIIYTHFDYKDYINKDTKNGLYNYYQDGFGPVCKDIKCTIDETIYEIKNNCKLRIKYLRKINKFFQLSNRKGNNDIYTSIINGGCTKSNIDTSYAIIFYIIILKLFYKRRKKKRKLKHFILKEKTQPIILEPHGGV